MSLVYILQTKRLFCFFFCLSEIPFLVAGRGAHTFMQKLEALCYRTLVGVGLIDVSYGSDFFNGLTQ